MNPHRIYRGYLPFAGALALALAGLALRAPAQTASVPPLSRLQKDAESALARRHARRAVDLFQRAVERDPKWKEGWWRLGVLLYQDHQFSAARIAFIHLTRLNRRLGAPWVLRGLCDFEMRDFNQSLLHIQEGIALGLPPDPNLRQVAFYHQAQDLILMRDYDQAMLILRYFPMHQHETTGVLYAYGLAALRIPLLSETLPQTIGGARLQLVRQVGRAEFLAGERKFALSLQLISRLVKAHPRTPNLHYVQAVFLASQGRQQASLQAFREELQINPRSVPARLQLASDNLANNHLRHAAVYLDEALKLQPQNFAAHYLRGELLMQQQHYHAAARELEISKMIVPDDSQIRYALAQAYLRLHRYAAARREQQAFLRLRPLASSLMQKGVLPASAFLPRISKKPVTQH